MAALVDTNVLLYRFDPRFPAKQRMPPARPGPPWTGLGMPLGFFLHAPEQAGGPTLPD